MFRILNELLARKDSFPLGEWDLAAYPDAYEPMPRRRRRGRHWSVERATVEAYERTVWTWKGISTIAAQQARLPFRYRLAGTNDVVDEHPLYRLLSQHGKANPLENGRALRKRISTQLLLSERGVFIEWERSRGGTVIGLHLLPPGRTRPVPGKDTPLDHYEVTSLDGTPRSVDADTVTWIREPHPLDPYLADTPMRAMGASVEMDDLGRDINVTWMLNDGLIRAVVGIRGQLGDNDRKRIERNFGRGPVDAGKVTVIEADDITYADVSARPRDMQYQATARNAKIEVLAALGVPESQLGNAAERTYANAEAEAYMFWAITMADHNALVASGFPDPDNPDLEPFLDTSQIEALQVPARALREEARQEFSGGLRSIKSYAELAGFDVPDTPQTRGLWLPSTGRTLILTAADARETDPAPGDEDEPDNSDNDDDAGDEDEPDDDGEGAAVPTTAGTRLRATSRYSLKTTTVRTDQPDHTANAQVQAVAGAALAALAGRWAQRTTARLRAPRRRKGTRHWQPDPAMPDDQRAGTKALDVEGAVDPATWRDEATTALEPILRSAATTAAGDAATSLTGQPPTQDTEPAEQDEDGQAAQTATVVGAAVVAGAAATALAAVLLLLGDAVQSRARRLVTRLATLEAGGASVEQLITTVESIDLVGWAQHLGADSASAAVEGARAELAARLAADGWAVTGRWRAVRDERTRPTHRAASGQRQPAGGLFRVGDALLRYPRDPAGPIEETAGCRCWIEWRAKR